MQRECTGDKMCLFEVISGTVLQHYPAELPSDGRYILLFLFFLHKAKEESKN